MTLGEMPPTPSVSMDRAIERRHQVRELFRKSIFESRVVVITLGLIEAWYDNQSGIYLNEHPSFNMVKFYPGRFSFEVLGFDKSKKAIVDIVENLKEMRGDDIKIMMTVSPVPLQRTFTNFDVITANCYSKSMLRAVAGEVSGQYDFIDYVPSYEAVTWSEHSSTWLDDQVHVSEGRVSRVVDRIVETYTR